MLLILKYWKRTKKLPGPLLAVAISIPLVYGLDLHNKGVEVVGEIPSGLPSPTLPSLDKDTVLDLMADSIFIALVGFIESISISKMIGMKHRHDVDANQELVALGACNIVGSMFLSFPVMGAFGRTAINDNAGAKSQLSLMISSVVLIVGVVCADRLSFHYSVFCNEFIVFSTTDTHLLSCSQMWLTPVFFFMPKCILSAIVIAAVIGLVDIKGAKHLWRVDRLDLAVMIVAFVCTLVLGVEFGVLGAMAFSMGIFIYHSTRPSAVLLGRGKEWCVCVVCVCWMCVEGACYQLTHMHDI